jgi:hypothetical protein
MAAGNQMRAQVINGFNIFWEVNILVRKTE